MGRLSGRNTSYEAALGPAQPKAEFFGGTAIGVLRHIFVADTDVEAERFGKPAMELHLKQLNWQREMHGVTNSRFTTRALSSESLTEIKHFATSPWL